MPTLQKPAQLHSTDDRPHLWPLCRQLLRQVGSAVMGAAEIRWRCERIAVLLQTNARLDALTQLAVEARRAPWLEDPRPPPAPLLRGYIHDGA